MNEKLKDKLKSIIGLIFIVVFIIGFVRSVYNRNFADPEFKILKSTPISSPIKNTLFWYEEELEKIEPGIGHHLSIDGSNLTESLYSELNICGMVHGKMKTMSEKATQEMIELDAYRGKEPNVIKIAEQKNYHYVFKVVISDASWKKRTNDLQNVTYHLSIYNVAEKKLIWEAEIIRLARFFGGMPDNEKTIAVIKKNLKEEKIIK